MKIIFEIIKDLKTTIKSPTIKEYLKASLAAKSFFKELDEDDISESWNLYEYIDTTLHKMNNRDTDIESFMREEAGEFFETNVDLTAELVRSLDA